MNRSLDLGVMRPSRLTLALVTCVAVLSGCANLAPDYQQPAMPIAPSFPSSGLAADARLPAAPDLGWRDFFLDDRLRRVVELTLANNRDLRVAALNIDKARAQYGIALASAYPSISLGATGNRARTTGATASNGQSRVASQYGVNLGLVSYELDFFGRVQNLGDAALESYFSIEETRRSTQISLIAEVASAWLLLDADTQRLQLARDTLASQQKSYDLIRQANALGAQSGIALAQAQGTVESARVQAATFDAQVEQDRNALTLLVGTAGLPADLLPQPRTGLNYVVTAQLLAPPADLPSSVLQQRPDVLAAEHALRSSNANIGAARAAFYPRITLTGSAGTASSSLSGLFDRGTDVWNFGPTITLPIFDGGANRANLKVTEVQQQIQLATYEKTLMTAFREVADALSARRTLAERLSAQTALVASTARTYELSQALFRSGGGAYLDVLDAQRTLYTAQQSLLDLQRVEQVNRLTIYKVLGGGWSEKTAVAAAS